MEKLTSIHYTLRHDETSNGIRERARDQCGDTNCPTKPHHIALIHWVAFDDWSHQRRPKINDAGCDTANVGDGRIVRELGQTRVVFLENTKGEWET